MIAAGPLAAIASETAAALAIASDWICPRVAERIPSEARILATFALSFLGGVFLYAAYSLATP